MPAIVVSSVNTGTDTLTAVAHGLFTGDRCRVRNVGGALPTGLTATVDVFALRLDVDNIKLCDTNAHALAGIGILDITGAGSGTNKVEYGLPYCIPNVVVAQGVQVPSVGLNGAWNALVALYDLLTGQAQSVFAGVALAVPLTTTAMRTLLVSAAAFQGSGVSLNVGLSFASFTGGGIMGAALALPAGARVLAMRVTIQDSGVTPTTVRARLRSVSTAGAIVDIASSAVSAGTGGIQTLPVSSGLPAALTTGHGYFITVGSVSGGDLVGTYTAEVDYDMPA